MSFKKALRELDYTNFGFRFVIRTGEENTELGYWTRITCHNELVTDFSAKTAKEVYSYIQGIKRGLEISAIL
jgi:hypothetical protein